MSQVPGQYRNNVAGPDPHLANPAAKTLADAVYLASGPRVMESVIAGNHR